MEFVKWMGLCLVLLAAVVTVGDIVIVHWILRRHRLFAGACVLMAEVTLVIVSVGAAAAAIHWL